jgi:CRP/FNR family cyclic AMP-dependent transcriptional regulator
MSMTDIQKLKLIPLFSTMDDQEIGGIRAIMDQNVFAPGQVIMREGEEGNHFHVILEGNVQFLTQDAAGDELLLDDAGPGGFFGELSMLTGEPRSARVRAVEEVKTLSLDRKEFNDFLMTHPHAAIDVMTVLGKRLHRSDLLLRQSVSQNINQIDDSRMTFGQRLSDGFASMMGSWKFIIWQSCLLAVWVIWNAIAGIHNSHHPESRWFLWDEYPFIFLNLALSFQAAYAAPIIMMSQNRSADKDRLAAEVDHTVNIKAEVEVGLIMRRLDDLERSIHYNHHEACRIFRGDAGPAAA